MKKIYILAVAAIFSTAAIAQVSEQGNAELVGTKNISTVKNLNNKAATDTCGWVPNASKWLPGEFALGGTVTLYGYTGGGSVFGTNISTNELDVCGQGYLNLGAATFGIEGILVGFYRKDEVTGNGTADFELWSSAANKAYGNSSGSMAQDEIGPDALLASVTVPIASVDTNWFSLTYGAFSSTVLISGTNFVTAVNSINIKTATDTVGIASDQLGEGFRMAYHLAGVNGNWYITNDLFGNSLDNNVAIFAVIDDNFVGVEDHDFYNNMQLSAYPNPAVNEATIAYNLNEDMDNVTLVVYDMTGKEVYNKVYGNQVKGSYKVSLDMSDYTSGNYFYSLIGNGNRFTKRMVVVK
ncbi:MAG: T9SS type A sorting domain-containing protein [Flavobacteriales bacterium]|nr:T9SS type A sorting domain-containing protein [Flavobacteriales bacterium]